MSIPIVLQSVLSQYVETHKRLVIPRLGTFLVKDPGRVVLFSEMLRRDDGILRSLLRERGLSEAEALAAIEGFVADVRQAVSLGRTFPLPGLGAFRSGANGTVAFVAEAGTGEALSAPDLAEGPDGGGSSAPLSEAASVSADDRLAAIGIPTGEPRPVFPQQPRAKSDETRPRRRPPFDAGRMAATMKSAFAESSARVPAAPASDAADAPRHTPPRPSHGTGRSAGAKRRGDRFIWIAAVAALLALSAILYGYWRDSQERKAESEWMDYPEPEETAAAAMRFDPTVWAAPAVAESVLAHSRRGGSPLPEFRSDRTRDRYPAAGTDRNGTPHRDAA